MACGIFVQDPPVVHWTRCHQQLPPVWIHSRAARQLLNLVHDKTSNISLLQGCETDLLPLIVSYAGLTVVQPCVCCRNDPVRSCQVQRKSFRVLGSSIPVPANENDMEPSYSSAPPLRLFQQLDQRDFLFTAEHIPTRFESNENWQWDHTSQSVIDHIGAISFCMLPGYQLNGAGLSYVYCTSQGFYSSMLNFLWEDVSATTTAEVDSQKRKHGYEVTILHKTQSQPYSKTFSYQALDNEKEQRYPASRELMAVTTVEEQLVLTFCSRTAAQELLRVLRSHQRACRVTR